MIERTEQDIMQNWQTKEPPIVSVCCTTYNHENFISEAIDGFLMQETNFPFEIIIRDDCSSDNTAEIVRNYAENYPHLIKPIFETQNCFSKGIKPMPEIYKKASGKYFALCEGDDYWIDPLKLQKQVDIFMTNSDVSICFHPAVEVDIDHNHPKIICKHFNENQFVPTKDAILGRGGYMPTASLMFKNERIEEMISSFKGAPIGDFFTQVYMGAFGDIYFIKDAMCVYIRNRVSSWTEGQKNKDIRRVYNYSMVKAIDDFYFYLNKRNDRCNLYKVLIFYSNGYISCFSGIKNKISALQDIINLLSNYRSLFYLIWLVGDILKNFVLNKIKYFINVNKIELEN